MSILYFMLDGTKSFIIPISFFSSFVLNHILGYNFSCPSLILLIFLTFDLISQTLNKYLDNKFTDFSSNPSVHKTPCFLLLINDPSSNHQMANDKGVILFNQVLLITNLFFLYVKLYNFVNSILLEL